MSRAVPDVRHIVVAAPVLLAGAAPHAALPAGVTPVPATLGRRFAVIRIR